MRHKYAVVALVVAIVLLSALFYVRAENEKYHVDGGDDGSGALVGIELSEDEFPSQDSRLWVYGNADEDDRIDEGDVEYLRGVLEGTNEPTRLCDANLDGTVDRTDLAYLERILAGDDMDVYYIDSYYRNAEVSWPVESIAIGYCSGAYAADLIGVCDKVDMVDSTIERYWHVMNSNFSSAASFGETETPNYEAMIREGIDVYVVGYCDSEADRTSPTRLNPVGIDVMFLTTADNSGVDYPNEHIDRSLVMLAFLLQGDMAKTYGYLDWHDDVLGRLVDVTSSLTDEQREAFIMSRTCPLNNTDGGISVTGRDNTNNIHAEWVGVDAVGQHAPELTKNYQTISVEQLIAIIEANESHGRLFYMDNEHDGMRGQYSLRECVEADAEMLAQCNADITYMAMAREAGNSPLYVVELAFYVCVMYPDLAEAAGIDYVELFDHYFETFSSEDYSEHVSDIEKFFYVREGRGSRSPRWL